jgi:hypothetical protein
MVTLTTRQLALLSALTATCLGIQLSPRPPNIEFTSLITFVIGVVFGSFIGGSFGAIVMFVNGFLSPWGVAGMIMPFQMAGMAIIGVAGGFYRKYKSGESSARLCIEAAILGAFLTLTYDIITNSGVAALALMSGIPIIPAFITTFITGIFFAIIHIISNTILFGFTFIPLSNVLQRFVGR